MFEPCSDSDDQQSKDSNPALALDVHPQIDELRNTLRDALPYCSGLAKLPAHSFVLFYGKAKDAKRMNLANASRAELVDLEQCGEVASFGVHQEAVVDPNYRRAMKLDRNYFAINLDVERSGILEAVRTAMFTGKDQNKPIRADLYSLNVYGKDCFFMRHKDTPRGPNMFGSLVLIFPTAHTGGTLGLSHATESWSFDAASYLETLQADDLRVAYIAFFSDVEHEVRKVTSGYRVTITYNLYYVNEVQYSLMANLRVIQPRGADKPQVKTTLESLLKDGTFMPNGGWLGFGLRHLYPLPTSFDVQEGDKCPLKTLHGMLKGIDAALYYACSELLTTPPTFYTVFEAQSEAGPQGVPAIVACPRVVKFDSHALESDLPIWQKLCLDWDGVLINFPFERRAHSTGSGSKTPSPEPHPTVLGVRAWHVHWVTSLSKANRVTTQFAAYGNEPMIGYLYQCICMLVKIGPPGMRAQEPAKPPPPPSPPAPRCHG
ncbi:hypothetical protein C2E23DRAFT_927282 [Lenzites betulinus]|nr:hypothetical protein C2E23DRAFT_927282 [Lenzites betulinus]